MLYVVVSVLGNFPVCMFLSQSKIVSITSDPSPSFQSDLIDSQLGDRRGAQTIVSNLANEFNILFSCAILYTGEGIWKVKSNQCFLYVFMHRYLDNQIFILNSTKPVNL